MADQTTTIGVLIRTYEKTATLMPGCLPGRVNDVLEQTGYAVLKELAGTRGAHLGSVHGKGLDVGRRAAR